MFTYCIIYIIEL